MAVAIPTIPPLEYPLNDSVKLRAAFLAHRAYIDSCVSAYAAAGVTNAADYIELCCARHAERPALEHVRLPSAPVTANATAAGSSGDDPPSVITYAQLDRMAGRMACMWLARGFGSEEGFAAGTATLNTTTASSVASATAATAVTAASAGAAATTIAAPIHFQSGNASDGVVGLLMENCPFYVCAWLSLAKLGRTVALLSTALKAPQLRHSIDIARARTLLISEKYRALWDETRALYEADGLQPPRVYWSRGTEVDLAPMHAFDASLGLNDTDLAASTTAAAAAAAAGTAVATAAEDDSAAVSADAPIEFALTSVRFAREASLFDFASLRRARRVGPESALFYINTSGTTGPSKAALFSHRRFLGAGVTWAWPMELTAADRYLVVLPLFHGNGGVVALSACMHVGAVALIREKFSVSTFWQDVARHRATAMIYVGELWRYLHNASRAAEKQLEQQQQRVASSSSSVAAASTSAAALPLVNTTLRVIAGNGLRADIWDDVCTRFARPPLDGSGPVRPLRVVEHYGMTEMPAGPYMNFFGRPGACGFIPPDIRAAQGADKLVLFDLDAGAVVRRVSEQSVAAGLGAEGGLVEVTEPGQTGEALFLLAPGLVAGASQADNPHTERGAVDATDATALTDPLGNPLYLPYRNYTDAAACARRVYRSAFAPLDAWFATGDLLSRDIDGFFFFQDRAGDSYRWKGHNVVSNEVAEVVAQFDQARVEECNVYGVTWPAQGEGRVGMACLLWREIDGDATVTAAASSSSSAALLPASFDPRALLSYLRRSLPSHAVPAFLRLKLRGRAGVTANSATSTFKFHKHLCAKEGFDPTIIGQQGDIVLWWPGAMGRTNNNNSAAETDASSAEEQYGVLTEAEFKRITSPQQ